MFDALKNPSPKKVPNNVGKQQEPDLTIVKTMNAPTNTAKQVPYGYVQKVIPRMFAAEPQRIQVLIDEAVELYCDLRINNDFRDGVGKSVTLRECDKITITIESDLPKGSAG
jgi:hypothetical protein